MMSCHTTEEHYTDRLNHMIEIDMREDVPIRVGGIDGNIYQGNDISM